MNPEDPIPQQAQSMVEDLYRKAESLPPANDAERARREAAREEASRRMIEEARRTDVRRRYEAACPEEFRNSDWNFPAIQPYRSQIDRILSYQLGPKGLLASGPSGRRKTGAMWALMERMACRDGHDIRFYTAFDFFSQMQEHVSYGRDDARGWVEAVARRPIVFIDDYGQHSVLKSREDWAQAWFFRFLDIRSGDHLPLFITTNLNADEIAGGKNQIRGDPLIRRLLMVCDPVQFETETERTARLKR